jgi:leucyl-tRNA synthetase
MHIQVLLLTPIAPHFCEHIWKNILGKEGFAINESFPMAGDVDEGLLSASHYLQDVAHNLRTALQAETRPKKGAAKILTAAEIYVAVNYPKWQEDAIAILKSCYDGSKFVADDAIVAALKPLMKERPNKKLIPFVMELKGRVSTDGPAAFERRLPFDEMGVISDNIDFLTRSLGLVQISVKPIDPAHVVLNNDDAAAEAVEIKRRQETSIPGTPTAYFYHRDESS